MDFSPTHLITITADGSIVERQLVCLVENNASEGADGPAYTALEAQAGTQADWEYTDKGWTFQGRATPEPFQSVKVTALPASYQERREILAEELSEGNAPDGWRITEFLTGWHYYPTEEIGTAPWEFSQPYPAEESAAEALSEWIQAEEE